MCIFDSAFQVVSILQLTTGKMWKICSHTGYYAQTSLYVSNNRMCALQWMCSLVLFISNNIIIYIFLGSAKPVSFKKYCSNSLV